MAPHSSTLAWKILWMEKPGRLQSMGSLRVRHDWATSLWLFTFIHWRRQWQPTPVFLPGESHGRRSLGGCSPWGCKESDTTERLHFPFTFPVLLPGKSHGQRSLVGCSPWGYRVWGDWATEYTGQGNLATGNHLFGQKIVSLKTYFPIISFHWF